MDKAGGTASKTTVDHALIRGLVTAGPDASRSFLCLEPASDVTNRLRLPAGRRYERVRDVHKDVVMDVLSESGGRLWRYWAGKRRRRWSNAERLQIVAAVGVNGETLAHCAALRCVAKPDLSMAPSVQETRAAACACWADLLPVDVSTTMLKAVTREFPHAFGH